MRKWLATVALLALALPPGAGAHAFLEASTPAPGASLASTAHGQPALHRPVSAALTHVQLFNGRGKAIGSVRVSGGRTASELRLQLPTLATGAYRLTYSTVSQDDLHTTRGTLAFAPESSLRRPGRPPPRRRARASARASPTSSTSQRSAC